MFLVFPETVLEALSAPLVRLVGERPELDRFRDVLRRRLLFGSAWERFGCAVGVIVGSSIVALAVLIGSLLSLTVLLEALRTIV